MQNDRIPRLVLALALSIGALSALPYFGYRFEYYPGDLRDSRFDMFVLEHGYKWISGQTPHSFLDAPFFYPVRGVISYSDNFLGALPFYAPWRWLGFDRETSFQIWLAIGFLLNFLAATWVFTRLRFHWLAALFGAYVFAFSQAAFAQIGHSQLHYRFAIPLAWYFLYQFLEQFSWKDLLGCLLFVAWQFYCSPYEGYFLTVFLVAFVLVTIIRKPTIRQFVTQATPASVAAQLAVVLGFVGALAVLAYPYMRSAGDPQVFATRWEETITMLPRPVSYLMSWPGNYETGWLYGRADLPLKHEHLMFVGLIPWVCVLFLLFTARKSERNPPVIPAILAMLGIMVLTLYVNGVSLYFALMRVPGVVGIRGVTRWILVLLLPFSIAVAQVVHLCRERLQNTRKLFALAALSLAVAALVLENHVTPYRSPKSEAQARLRALAEKLPVQMPQEAILAYLQPGEGFERQPYDLDAMLLAQDKNVVTVNGYSTRAPKGYRSLRTCADLKIVLDDTAQQNAAFPVHDAAAQVVVLGTAVDAPCKRLNAPRSVQTAPLPDRAFQAKIQVQTVPAVTAASALVANVRVTNESDVLWRAKGLSNEQYAMRIGCRWIDSDAPGPLPGYDNRFDFPYDVPPGDTASLVAALNSPSTPGSYTLECDAVQELVHWFASMGSPTGTLAVLVTGGEGPSVEGFLDFVGDERIAGWAWDKNHPNRPVQVEIYDGDERVATVSADVFRPDLLHANKGNGAHGFTYPNHRDIRNGKAHTVRVLVSGRNFELVGSPKTIMASR
jgi:hypothetical protein